MHVSSNQQAVDICYTYDGPAMYARTYTLYFQPICHNECSRTDLGQRPGLRPMHWSGSDYSVEWGLVFAGGMEMILPVSQELN